jgi:hypothetical protein
LDSSQINKKGGQGVRGEGGGVLNPAVGHYLRRAGLMPGVPHFAASGHVEHIASAGKLSVEAGVTGEPRGLPDRTPWNVVLRMSSFHLGTVATVL